MKKYNYITTAFSVLIITPLSVGVTVYTSGEISIYNGQFLDCGLLCPT